MYIKYNLHLIVYSQILSKEIFTFTILNTSHSCQIVTDLQSKLAKDYLCFESIFCYR